MKHAMQRRDFLKHSALVGVGAAVLSALNAGCSAKVKQPNILFLFADDWARYAGVYRDPNRPDLSDVAQTPNIDQLARDGVLFTNAFNAVPSCTPCRGSIITGQYFWRNGRATNLGGGLWPEEAGLWESLPKFPNILEDLGYHNAYHGKIGVDWWPDAHPFFKPEQRKTPHGNKFMNFSQNVMLAEDHEAAKQEIWDEVLGNFRHFLSGRKEGQPFFYWFGPYHTHRSWIQGSGKTLWGIEPDDLKGKLPPDWPDVHAFREDVADYLGEVKAFDVMVGLFIDELERIGELDNTLIVATGDNGIPGLPRSKRNIYDKGIYCPLMMRWDARMKKGRTVEDFVNLMDLAPTFVEAAGGTPPDVMTGKSLMPQITSKRSGQIDPERDFVVSGRERHVVHYPCRGIRTRDYLYIRNYKLDARPVVTDDLEPGKWINIDGSPSKTWLIEHRNDPEVKPLFKSAFDRRPREELYDLKNDPDQMINVADDPTYAEAKENLWARLLKIMTDTNDPRVAGDDCIFDYAPYVGDKYY